MGGREGVRAGAGFNLRHYRPAVGMGKPSAFAPLVFEEAGGAAAALLARETAATIGAHAFTADQAAQVALGATLRTYRFDRYRTKEKPEDKPKLSKLTLLVADP